MITLDFKNTPTDVPLTVENVKRLADRAAELATAYARRIGSIQQQVDDARQRFGREAQDTVASAGPDGRNIAKQFAKQQEASRIAKFRAGIILSSRQQREELLKPFAKLASDAEFLLSLNQSPAQMLGRVALGDPKRTDYQAQLEGAGPVELQTAATTAIATNDLPLAAAIVTIVDRRPKDRRPFPVSEFAAAVMGKQHTEVTRQLKGVIVAFNSAMAADREFERGRADPLRNVSLALARRSLAQATTGSEA